MTTAEPMALAAVVSFVERQELNYKITEEKYCAKIEIRSGARTASLSVYNLGVFNPSSASEESIAKEM